MTIEIRPLDPAAAEVMSLVAELDQYLLALYPAESNHLDPVEELSKPHVCFLGALLDGEPVGCGAVKLLDSGYAEIKRIYVRDVARGQGLARKLLTALEQHAVDAGYTLIKLETGIHQTEALRLFENNGYAKTARFGQYPEDPLSVFMEKPLAPTSRAV